MAGAASNPSYTSPSIFVEILAAAAVGYLVYRSASGDDPDKDDDGSPGGEGVEKWQEIMDDN